MVRVLALLLSLLSAPALAQGTLTTIVSPSTLIVSCNAGCGGAGTVSTSPVVVTPISQNGVVDPNNSTTTPLAGGASFTGTSTSTLGYGTINLLVFSDQSSASGGVKIEFSTDGTNWDDGNTDTFTAGSPAPNAGQAWQVSARGQFYRIVYTNGATPQGTFRLQSVLRAVPTGAEIQDVDVPVNANDHGSVTKSVVFVNGANAGINPLPLVAGPGSDSNALRTVLANGTSLSINNTVTTSLVAGLPTLLTSPTVTLPISQAVGTTFPVSLSAGLPTIVTSPAAGLFIANSPFAVTQATTPWAINGGVTVSGTVPISQAAGTTFPITAGTLTTSPVAGGTYPIAGAVTAGGTFPVSVGAGVTFPVSLSANTTIVNSPVAGNYPVTVTNTVTTSASAGGSYPVTIGATSASPFSVAEQNGSNYPNRASWFTGSASTNAATTTMIVSQSGANKIYVTDLYCTRNDAGTTGIILGFNAALTTQTSASSFFFGVPAPSQGGFAQAHFGTPLVTAASTSLQYSKSAATVSVQCTATGFYEP